MVWKNILLILFLLNINNNFLKNVFSVLPYLYRLEVPKEKTHYDVELQEFDAATKIKLIKEVRAILGLGLKEAKETVESAPCWLKKELIKDEAESLKEKLESLGAKVRLA